EPRAPHEGRPEDGGERDSDRETGNGGRDRRTDSVPGIGSGKFHQWRDFERERRLGVVRIAWRHCVAALLTAALGVLAATSRAQNPETMSPEASAAKAKQILKQLLDALGGPLYLNVKSISCDGRMAQFGHSEAMTGYIAFREYRSYPDKRRIE